MLALLREISLRHWTRSPLRSALVVLGIALGVALYVATETAAASMFTAFNELVERVSGRADLTVESAGAGVPTELVPDVSEVDGVAHAAATLELTAQVPELKESLLILGVDVLGDLHFLPFEVEEGEKRFIKDPLRFVNDPTAILLSKRFAERHGLGVDDKIELLTSEGPKDFTIWGVLEDSGPAASFDGQVALMFIDAAQIAFSRGTLADRIDIAVEEGADKAAVQNSVRDLVGTAFTVERPEQLGTRLRRLVGPLHGGLWLSGFLALLVGGFLVYNAVGVAVAQRRREIGLLRAFGVTRRATTALFAAEAAMLATPGIAIGLLLGTLLSKYSTQETLQTLDQVYFAVPQVEPKLTTELIVESIVAGLLTAVLAAWWPARRGASLDPAGVLRGSASVEASPVRHRPMLVVGLVLVAAAWIPALGGAGRLSGALSMFLTVAGAALVTPAAIVGLRKALVRPAEAIGGLPARLGLDYVERALGRSTVNVLALMVAVSMSVSVGGWLSSLERSIVDWADQMAIADLSVTQGSPILDRRHVVMSGELTDRIAKVPGVGEIQRFRMTEQRIGDRPLRLVATDTAIFQRASKARGKSGYNVVEGASLEEDELANEPLALISDNAARLMGLGVGDTVELPAPTGPLPVKIRAVIVDYTADTGAIFIDRRHYLEHWNDPAVDGAFVYLEDGADPDHVAEGIRNELGGAGAVFVTKTAALREQLVRTMHDTFAYSRSVELVTLLIALMGVVGTMAATVIDRAREIGMLRAIGGTTRQVASAIVIEAGFLGFCAAVVGAVVGLVECRLFLGTFLLSDTGWHLEFVFPWLATLRIGGLVVLTSAIAGGLPAWRAARADVASAVVCE